jgi:hypothetical protein
MKDVFGNTKPVQIEVNEWWFNGRIIVKQEDFRLPQWISFMEFCDEFRFLFSIFLAYLNN